MADANSSNVDWGQRLAEVQLDLDQIWQKADALMEAPVGDTADGEIL